MASSSATRTRLQELPGRSNSIDPAFFPAIPIIGVHLAAQQLSPALPWTLIRPIGTLALSRYEGELVREGW
ncbi:MAG TPA: hypothetical protein VN828_17575 [Acidobacteriaceae bacterium]|nr:hypothetical protein [Acidobacteriaceae bacterium]